MFKGFVASKAKSGSDQMPKGNLEILKEVVKLYLRSHHVTPYKDLLTDVGYTIYTYCAQMENGKVFLFSSFK